MLRLQSRHIISDIRTNQFNEIPILPNELRRHILVDIETTFLFHAKFIVLLYNSRYINEHTFSDLSVYRSMVNDKVKRSRE